MHTPNLRISITMAFIMGLLLPAAETARRINQILAFEDVLRWFDDYLLGAVLLLAAFVVRNKPQKAGYLVAAWGVAAGALTGSLLGQLDGYFSATADDGIFASGVVVIGKAVILIYILIGLYFSLKANRELK